MSRAPSHPPFITQCPTPLPLVTFTPSRRALAEEESVTHTLSCHGQLDTAARSDYARFRAAVVAASTEVELRAAVAAATAAESEARGGGGWWAWAEGRGE